MNESTSLVERTWYSRKEDLVQPAQYLAKLVGSEQYSASCQPNAYYFIFEFLDEKTKKTSLAGIILNTTSGSDRRFNTMLNSFGISRSMFSIIKLSSLLGLFVLIKIVHGQTKQGNFFHRIVDFVPATGRVS
ncbi:hypothetical protein HZC07_01990 [Candidatus Micrarchaeota archaeon]|nr:hypothetical protein [Candidatus Micrarchaeota archaeon]